MLTMEEFYQEIEHRAQRSPNRLIKVTWPDGEEICYKSSIYTVLKTLEKIGESRLGEITLETGKHPLVSQEIFSDLKECTREIIPGWYYIDKGSTGDRHNQLININRELNLGLKIEVSDKFKGKSNPSERQRRPKNRLVVTLPDGHIVDYESFQDVFMACIDKLGARKISSKANIHMNGNRQLLTVTNVEGNRRRIDETLYLAIPYCVKDAAVLLRLIAQRLGVNMDIEVLPLRQNR